MRARRGDNTKRLPKAARTELARTASLTRWQNERARHYDRLIRIRQEILAAEERIADQLAGLEPRAAKHISSDLARILGAFQELWKFSGHDLPPGMRDYAAGVIDELHRQSQKVEAQPG